MFFSGLTPFHSLKLPIQIIILLFWSPVSPLSHRAPSRAVALSQGLSIPTWTGITPCSNIFQELIPFRVWTPPVSYCNTQLPFHSNSSSSFISIWTFCVCHYWVLSGWFRGTYPALIKDTSVTLSPQIKRILWRRWSKILVKLWKRFKLEFPPRPRQKEELTLCLWPDKWPLQLRWRWLFWHLPCKKKTHFFSYFHDNLQISNIQGSSSTLRTNFWFSQLFLAVFIIHID